MKKQICILSLLFAGCLIQSSFAEDQVVSLKDGSQIKGELVGVGNGSYTIHTNTMGDIKVPTAQVSSISNGVPAPALQPASTPAQPSSEDMNQKIQAAQTKLMGDPQMMQQVATMAQDPELMKLLSDPALVQAVTSHDVKAIEANPKAQELMNNPKMRALMEQLRGSTQ